MKLSRIPLCWAALILVVLSHSSQLLGQQLSGQETAIARSIDAEAPAAVALLEKVVNINSGTFNPTGVVEVGKVLESELQSLGFTTRWIPMDAVKRAPSLIAERRGNRGKRVLLLGHMDTVFEPSSPFQKFVRTGDIASGPGTSDMKGGIIVILSALKALKSAGALDGSRITVFITGDEESAGEPTEISRKEMVEAGKNSDAALSFEGGVTENGKDYATTARRGATSWELHVHGKTGHSSAIFTPTMGDGAVFELSRILNQFHDTLREPNMTYGAGLVLGGSNIKVEPNGDASVSGKANIIPGEAVAIGDLRVLTPEQLLRVKEKMQSIVSKNLPGTQAELTIKDKYPPMAPTPGNIALLAKLNEGNRALGLPDMEALDPMLRGAGDVSFVAPFVDSLDGLGAVGTGAHAPGETVDLSRLPLQSKRTALLLYRLTQ
jgi:glutamate carboxypeptidase